MKLELFYGFLIGLITSVLGCFLFITLFTPFGFVDGMVFMLSENKIGKLITLGTLLNLVVFWILLHLHKEIIARGIVLAVIVLTIATLFV